MIQMWLICSSGTTAYLWLMYGTTALKKSCEWEYGALNQAQGAVVVKNLTACLVPSVPLTCKSQLASLLVSRVWLDLWFWSFDFVLLPLCWWFWVDLTTFKLNCTTKTGQKYNPELFQKRKPMPFIKMAHHMYYFIISAGLGLVLYATNGPISNLYTSAYHAITVSACTLMWENLHSWPLWTHFKAASSSLPQRLGYPFSFTTCGRSERGSGQTS